MEGVCIVCIVCVCVCACVCVSVHVHSVCCHAHMYIQMCTHVHTHTHTDRQAPHCIFDRRLCMYMHKQSCKDFGAVITKREYFELFVFFSYIGTP